MNAPEITRTTMEEQRCGACGNEETVGIFRNEKRDLEVFLCKTCEKTSAINGFFKMHLDGTTK